MKSLIFNLLLGFATFSYAESNSIVGRYEFNDKHKVVTLDITKNRDVYRANLTVETQDCMGEVDSQMKKLSNNVYQIIKDDEDGRCQIQLNKFDNKFVIKEKLCADFHGMYCQFDATVNKTGEFKP